jgi:hypothetical protein
MIEQGELASGLGGLGTILAEPAKFIPRYSVKKVATTQKKVLKLGIQIVIFFVHRIEWDRSKIYKIYKVLIQLTWYYFGVLASWEKKPMKAGTLMELVLACALYGVLPMRFESNLRVLTTLAVLVDLPGLRQCEHAWLKLRRWGSIGWSSVCWTGRRFVWGGLDASFDIEALQVQVAHGPINNDEVKKSYFYQKKSYTSFYLELKNNNYLYTQFEDFFLKRKVFLTKYRGMNLAGSAKMVPSPPSRLRLLSSLLSQSTCTLVSRVVKPDGDEPN